MYSLRNILIALTLFSAVPLSLSAPTTAEENALITENEFIDEIDQSDVAANDVSDVLDILQGRSVNCGITSAPRKNCQLNQCPPDRYCKVTPTGRCGWKVPKRKRPFGCSNCKCYVRES